MSAQNGKPPDGGRNQRDGESDASSTARKQLFPELHRSSSRFVTDPGDNPIVLVGPNNEEILPEDIIVAPDGGWGWVVVFAAFMSNLIVDGTIFSFGLLMEPMVRSAGHYKTNDTMKENKLRTDIAWTGGMLSGFYLFMGPVASSMSNIFGFRITAMVGGFTAFFGFLMAWVLNPKGDTEGPNLQSLYGFVGFLGGVGLCLVYVPSIITVGFYFDKKRALATGIAVCGSGFGTFIYAPMIGALVKQINWPKTLLVEACLILSSVLIAAIYRPLKPVKRTAVGGDASMNEAVLPTENTSAIIPVSKDPKEGAQHQTGDDQPGPGQSDVEGTASLRSTKSTKSGRTITLVVDPSGDMDIADSRMFRVASIGTLNKPLHRTDIFYSGTVRPSGSQETTATRWEAVPVTPDETGEIVALPPKTKWCKCCTYTFPILRKMLDFSLLKSVTFVLLASSGGISFLGFFVPFAYIKELTMQNLKKNGKEFDVQLATALVAFIGVANTIGRVVCGLIADKVSKRILLINNVALTVAGVSTILAPLITSYAVFVVYACVFGLSVACFISLRSILVVQLMGISKLTNAFGLLCLFQGMAAFIGSPLAGIFKETTHKYNLSFHAAGAFILIAGILCYPINLINAWEKKRTQEKELILVQVL